jgi:lysyl-tRNA synthetase class II
VRNNRILSLALAFVLLQTAVFSSPAKHYVKPGKLKPAVEKPKVSIVYEASDPLALVKDPEGFTNKPVSFDARFVSFSSYALDYKAALRSSKDYISFLIERPDVTDHVLPLSELKLIFSRKLIDKVMDIESGDSIKIKGKVFSSALGDPWMDVDELVLLEKSPENLAKAKKKIKKKS